MKKKVDIILVFLLILIRGGLSMAGDFTVEPGLSDRSDLVFYGGFEDNYNNSEWESEWGVQWDNRASENEVVSGFQGGNSLRVTYPAGGVGPSESGTQFPMCFRDMEGLSQDYFQELYLRYYLKFEDGFDYGGSSKGGKLPGLMGGGNSWSRSGGDQPDGTNGWTLRFMWRDEGKIVVYAYVPPSDNGKWGSETWGQDIMCDFTAEPGTWHCIEQYVNVGTPGSDDGQLKVWIDGIQRLDIDDMRFWDVENDSGRIGGIYVSTFHGGSGDEWAPSVDSYTRFDGFAAATSRVGLYGDSVSSIKGDGSSLISESPVRVGLRKSGIMIRGYKDKEASAELFDHSGRRVKSEVFPYGADKEISLDDVSPGAYLMLIKDSDRILRKSGLFIP